MTKVKKVFGVAFAALFTVFTFFSYVPAQAASNTKTPIIPQVQFVSTPTTEYAVGDRVKFDISSPNYGGKVEYRVILWNDSTKSYSDLWNSSNGYPNRYYTKWQPWGNNVFTLGWTISEPGSYRITVYAKRVGVPNEKALLKGMNCDSYKESVAFTVKPKVAALDKDGQTYGSDDASKPLAIKNDVNITAKNVIFNNANVEGNINITGDNAALKNITATGKIVVDPGKDGSTTLENVTAKAIEVLSGGTNSIHIKNVKSDSLVVNSTNPVRVETDGDTEIVSTTANGYVIFDKKSGTFGTITITKSAAGETVVEFRGDIKDKVVVETQATITTTEGSKLENLVIATTNPTDKVILQGTFNKVEINKEAAVEISAGSSVQTVEANANANISVDKDATVQTLDKNGNTVPVSGDGEVVSGGDEDSNSGGSGGGSSGGSTVYDDNAYLNAAVENLITKYDALWNILSDKKYINVITKNLSNSTNNDVDITLHKDYENTLVKDLAYISLDKLVARGTLESPEASSAFNLLISYLDEVQVGEEDINDYVASKLPTKLAGKSYSDKAVTFAATPNVANYNALYAEVAAENAEASAIVAAFREMFPVGAILRVPSVELYGLTLDSVTVNGVFFYRNGNPVDRGDLLTDINTVFGKSYDELKASDLEGKTVVVKFKYSNVIYTYNVEITDFH